jgi:hypothetical protein
MSYFSQPGATACKLYLTVSNDGGGGVLFDPERDRLLKLNATGVEMWHALNSGQSESDIAGQLACKYGVDRQQVLDDLHNLVSRAAELGLSPSDILLAEQQPPDIGPQTAPTFPWYGHEPDASRPLPRRFTILSAVAGLALFDCVLSLLSFNLLCRSVKAWPLKPRRAQDKLMLIGQVCAAVEKACVWYPKKALCLQRSAVTTCILRSYGIQAQMIVGVRPMPFLAHAWVETEGSVVNDFPNVRKFYQMLTAY